MGNKYASKVPLTRYKTCLRKQTFETRLGARKHISDKQQFLITYPGLRHTLPPLHAYRCNRCDKWHITSRTPVRPAHKALA